MPKCIVILLDGTWNDSEADGNDTNIVRIRELISESLDPISPTAAGTRRTFTYADRNGAPQSIETSVYYDRGVGTGGLLDRPLGGAFGVGLERNVRRAYRYLAHNYEPGDHVFVLGFSRGAYTARSLVGLIAVAGLLKRENSSRINELRCGTTIAQIEAIISAPCPANSLISYMSQTQRESRALLFLTRWAHSAFQ